VGRIGRPPKVDIEKLIDGVDEYIANADPPIVAEYAHKNNITRQYLYELAGKCQANGDNRLTDAIKAISEAKEVMLEKKGLNGEYTGNMAIFSLKQLGWSDKVEQKTTAKVVDLSGMSTEELKKILDDDV
jgi:hypothetical protein